MKKWGLLALLATVAELTAAVSLPAVFSDHAVLAKRNGVPVFGTADPGEEILLAFDGKTYSAITGNDGKWQIKLDLAQTSPGPHTLKVNHLTVKDILVGEVFLASGQSNMAFRLNRAAGYEREKALPANTSLRFFNVAGVSSKLPAADVKGKWEIVTPDTVGQFSAVAYFFAKKLQHELNVPVGIINSSVGGTEIECWMSTKALSRFKESVRAGRKRDYLYESYPRRYAQFLEKNRAWEQKYGRIDDGITVPENAGWQVAKPPVAFGNGVYFLRTRITVSPSDAANGFRINLMRSYCPMELYIDGKRFAVRKDDSAYKLEYFTYNVKKGKLAPGKHELMLRFFVSHDRVRLPRIVYIGTKVITENEWEICCAKNFGKPAGECLKERPRLPGMLPSRNRLWSRLYNGMIHPLMPYRFSGMIWYQGESNEKDAATYRKLFPAFIRDMRRVSGDAELPFFFCQLAAFRAKSAAPGAKENWPRLRDAQSAALKLPATGMAVLTDAGEALDIHPLDKQTPGERLAALALKQIYHRDIPASGPVAQSAVADGGKVTVKFSAIDGGLTVKVLPEYYHLRRTGKQRARLVRNSPQAQVEGFAVAGKDGKWFWADKAEISGDSVIVSAAQVPAPVKVRFGWMDNPTVNLYNGAGFPAVPFELSIKQP